MNDLDVSCSTSTVSIRCSSRLVPRVTTARACVLPRVNSADPWVRGNRPTWQLMGRISSGVRPSTRSPFSMICARSVWYSIWSMTRSTWSA